MTATQIKDALAGEDLIGIQPQLLQQVTAGWLQRLSLFTGRTLSDTALTNEQLYRAGRLTMLGQAVTPGTVQGLDLSVDPSAADPVITLTPGYGIDATGQDVTLLRSMKTTLSGLPVLDGTSGSYIADFSKYTAPAGQPWAGILLLQAIVVQVPGSVVDTGAANLIVSGNLNASCNQDPAEYAFGDSQIVDASRLVLLTWPTTPASLAMPAALPAANWRNRLVYTVFNAELELSPDDGLPWGFFGVPVALAGFDATSKLLFADVSSVVRTGGLPRRRYILPGQDTQGLMVVEPALANARVNQLAEQLGQVLTPSSPAGLIAGQFALLPPAGVLPPYTMDFVNKVALWCPSNWTVSAAPVFAEELEGILQGGMTAAPLDTTANETIEIFVPLPDAVYDPNVLVTEAVDPVFQQEVNAASLARNVILQHRKVIELEANALAPLLDDSAIDLNAGLTADEISGRDGASVFTPDPDEAYGTTLSGSTYVSVDLQNLQKTAAAAPYTVTVGSTQIPLFSSDDWTDLQNNGIQHFINRINAKIDNANDLLDLAFLTAQTDIYRYRQNVLGTTDASRLSVSPILANIASGDTAAATAQNIQDYLTSIAPAATTPPPAAPQTTIAPAPTTAPPATGLLTNRITTNLGASLTSNTIKRILSPTQISVAKTGSSASASTASAISKVTSTASIASVATRFTGINAATEAAAATPVEITQQQPIVGAQLNLRTLTIAERLAPSTSQEALFYSIANRIAFLELLADLEITIDDLPVLVDNLPSGTTPYTMADLRSTADPTRTSALLQLVNNPQITTATPTTNPDESTLFSTGVHVLEQHTQLMRAVEARIQQYQDFLTLCGTALANVQSDMQSAQKLLAVLQNDLAQARQNLTFVQSLLADEQARVANVNSTRANVLQTYVQFVAYTRPRTLIDTPRTPSRQLLPAAVANPVPACLNQSVAIPPELREMVALLREAPVAWFPPVQLQINNLERPTLLQSFAVDIQARAAAQLQTPPPVSSAASAPGLYSNSIANVYSADQSTFRGFEMQRAAFDPKQLANLSWSSQVGVIQNTAALADLMSSASVHTEISNFTSRSLQQISSVATCLYTRVGNTLPVTRLAWAEFLQNTGAGVNLKSLAVLPGWNNQDYTDRQQMQLIVDWLFQQIDITNTTAVALMSDVVAVAILLASNAPVDNIIAGAVAARANATVGGTVRLTLPSDRIAHGMFVQLYSGANLAARAVVSDLDTTGVTATITDVYSANVSFQANDVAHFTALQPDAVVYKAFSD